MDQIADSALDTFFDICARATWAEPLWQATITYFEAQGVSRVVYHHMPPLGTPDEGRIRVATHGFPQDWVRKYIRGKLYRVDPIPAHASMVEQPFRWSEIRDLRGLSAAEVAFLDSAAEADLGDGWAIQAFGPGGRNGYFGIGMPPCPIDRRSIQTFQAVCQAAHLRYCRITRDYAGDRPVLSDREAELLHWVARGKSNSVIAEIMRISPHTVDAYMRRIFLKLGTTDRISAAVRALGLNLIRGY
ncbi:MAG: LuxR family transcriptional regulator [Pseudomonadota bacterium]